MRTTIIETTCDRCLAKASGLSENTPEGWVIIDAGAFMPDLCPACFEAFQRWCNTSPAAQVSRKAGEP